MAHYDELKGKRVMITGAASGIGLATAQRFADEGASVFVVDYNEKATLQVMSARKKMSFVLSKRWIHCSEESTCLFPMQE